MARPTAASSPMPGLSMPSPDDSHGLQLQSWVASANDPASDFPIQNLPYGRFRSAADPAWRIGVAIGSQVLDLQRAGLLSGDDLHPLMAAGPSAHRAMRQQLSQGLREGSAQQAGWSACLLPQHQAEMALPCRIGDYTDFFTGIHHANTVGRLFRPDNPLLPNYKWLPVGYHGRASSIVVGGTAFHRPVGQTFAAGASTPTVGPSARLDFELELAAYVGSPNALGHAVTIAQAEEPVGLGIVGCESASAVHFPPAFCPIAGLWACKSGENCPRWGRFSLSTPQVRQAPRRICLACRCSTTGAHETCKPGSTSRWGAQQRGLPRGAAPSHTSQTRQTNHTSHTIAPC